MAGRIPQVFIDDLMARVDIVEVIDGRVPLKKAGKDLQACCPFHTEKTPSFTVSPTKQFYHCFGCGAHGTALGFLMEFEHMDFVEAVEDLARQVGLTVPRQSDQGPGGQKATMDPLYRILDQAAAYYCQQLREHPAAKQAVDYLKARGLSGEIAKTYNIGYAPPGWNNLVQTLGGDTEQIRLLEQAGLLLRKDGGNFYDRFRDRIQFPIRDRRGRVIGFGGRVLAADTPKYMNSPETPLFHKGRELYGLYEARKSTARLQRLVVVEGYMDTVALAQFGITYVVATLGTATTPEHLGQLFRIVPEVVFCFDGDEAGRKAAWRALENALGVLRDGREARFLFLPEGEDPDSLVRKEGKSGFETRITGAIPFSDFFYQALSGQVDLSSMEGRARLVELAKPLLSKLSPGVFRQLMLARLAELAGTGVDQLGEFQAKPQKVFRVRAPAPDPTLNPVRRAINLVLHYPKLAKKVPDLERLADIDIPGVSLLIELITFARQRPEATLGLILEHWRDSADAPHLEKLARLPVVTPASGREQEFLHTLELLAIKHQEHRLALLDQKLQGEGLTKIEQNEWKQLLTVRHRPSL